MRSLYKITSLLTALLCGFLLRPQQSQKNSIDTSFAQITTTIEILPAKNDIAHNLQIFSRKQYPYQNHRDLTLYSELFLMTWNVENTLWIYENSLEYAKQIGASDIFKSSNTILPDLHPNINQFSTAYRAGGSLLSPGKELKTLLLKTKKDIKEIIQENRSLELENEDQYGKIRLVIIVLALLFLISSLAIYSYLKVRQENNILINRTIELAAIQLKMQKELAGYLKTERNSSDSNLNKVQPSIDEDVKEIIMIKLEKLEKEIFFLDPNCSLHLLSEQLKTNPKYLSQVINQEKKSNFNNYINELRINYLLPKLRKDLDYRNSKLSYIAVSLGYNNLNTFNSAFKKRMGILPSKFITELNSSFQLEENHT